MFPLTSKHLWIVLVGLARALLASRIGMHPEAISLSFYDVCRCRE